MDLLDLSGHIKVRLPNREFISWFYFIQQVEEAPSPYLPFPSFGCIAKRSNETPTSTPTATRDYGYGYMGMGMGIWVFGITWSRAQSPTIFSPLANVVAITTSQFSVVSGPLLRFSDSQFLTLNSSSSDSSPARVCVCAVCVCAGGRVSVLALARC